MHCCKTFFDTVNVVVGNDDHDGSRYYGFAVSWLGWPGIKLPHVSRVKI